MTISRYELFIQGQIQKAVNENKKFEGKKKNKQKQELELDESSVTRSIPFLFDDYPFLIMQEIKGMFGGWSIDDKDIRDIQIILYFALIFN